MTTKFCASILVLLFVFCARIAHAQCGDNCSNATPLTVTALGPCTYVNCTTDSASGATASGVAQLPCSGVNNNDVWYTFNVPAGVTQLVGQVHGLQMTYPIIYFYRGGCGSLFSIGCNTGNPPASTASLTYGGFVPGEQIWVRIKALGGRPDGTFQLCVYNPCPGGAPANDEPCNATVVTMTPTCNTYTTISKFCATASAGITAPGCGNYLGGDVWIRTTVGANGHLEANFQLQTLSNPAAAIYTGTSCSALTLVACNDDGGFNPQPYMFVTSLPPNATVWIRIWASGSATDFGTVGVCLTDPCPGGGPTNDDPCSALVVPMSAFPCTSYTTVNNTCAGGSTGVPPPGCASYSGGDVWVRTVSPSGRIEVNFQEQSLYDVGAAIYTGTCSSLVLLACNDDDGPNAMPYLYYNSGIPNITFWIRVWDYGGNNTGSTGLCITDPCPGGTVSPPLYDNPVAMCPPPPLANQLPVSNTGTCTNYITLNSICAASSLSNVPANVPAPTGCGSASYPPSAFAGWDVWATVTVPLTPPVAFLDFNTQAGSIYNLDMAVYRVTPPVGTNCNTGVAGAYTLIACDDNNGTGSMPYLHLPYGGANTIQPGDVLYVRMWRNFGGMAGDWGICINTSCPGGTVAPPGYDDPPCPATANLIPVTGGTCATYQLADINACLTPTSTTLASIPSCAFGINSKDIWFVMQMPASGSGQLDFNFQSGLSLTDPTMAIYSGLPVACGGPGLTEIACDDDGGDGTLPYVSLANNPVPAGQYLFIRVWAYGGLSNGTIGLCISDPCPAQPVNDLRCNATSLTIGNTCNFNTFQLTCANNSDNTGLPPPGCGLPNPTSGTGPGRDIWFSFTAPASGSVVIDTREGSLTNVDIALYRSSNGNDCIASFILVSCDDNNGLGEMPYLSLTNLVAGVTYYLRVWEHGNDQDGSFSMCLYNPCPSGPPTNNEICNATFIALNNSITGNNNCTTFDPGINNSSAPPPSCWINTSPFNTNTHMNTSWFKAVGSNNYSVVVTPGTLSRPQIAVYSGTTCGLITASNIRDCDAGLPGGCKSQPNAAVVEYTVPQATDTLYIAVEGVNNQIGTFEISVYNTLLSSILPVPFFDCRKAVPVCGSVTSVANPGRIGSGNQCDLGSSFSYKAYESAPGALCAAASTTVTVGSTDGLSVGMSISNTGAGIFKTGTRILSITSATQFTISSAPTTALTGASNVISGFIDPSYVSAPGATSSGTTITVQNTAGLYAGMTVTSSGGTGGNFPAGTTVVSISTSTQFVASAAPIPAFAGSTVVTGTRYAVDNRYPEVNSSWYFFSTTATSGNITFDITGNSSSNYDFVLWELTGAAAVPGYFSGQNTTNDSIVCSSVSNIVNYGLPLRTNVYNAASSASGLSSTYLTDPAFSPPIPTSSVRTFLLVVMNSGGNSQGFTLDFGSSPINYTATSVVWNGAAGNSDWFEANNWGDCAIPQCNTSAIITGGTPNQPLIASSAQVKNLIISAGSSLTLGPGVTLFVCGDLTNSGDFHTDPSSTVKFVGTGPQAVSGNFNGLNQFANFVVEKASPNPVTLQVNADIGGDLRTSNANSVLNATGRYIKVGGNFTNANGMATFIGQSGTTIEFNGTGVQTFRNFGNGGARPFSINSIVINQQDASNDYVELDPNGGGNTDNNLRIGNRLTLVRGRIFTNQWEVYSMSSSSASVTANSSNSYIEGTHSRNVRMDASAGSPYIFATGIGGSLEYASIEKAISGTSSDTIKLRATFNSWPGTVPHGPVSSECAVADWSAFEAYDNGFWRIDSIYGTAAIGSYTLNLRPSTTVGNNAGSQNWSIMKRTPSGSGAWMLDGVCRAYFPHCTAYNVYRDQMHGFSDFAITQYNIGVVGINEAEKLHAFSLIPNPASSQVGIRIDAGHVGSVYTISDIYGKSVLRGKLFSENTKIDISQLSDGIYLFTLEDKSRQLFQVIGEK